MLRVYAHYGFNHAGYGKVKHHNVTKKSNKVTADKRYIDEVLGDRKRDYTR